MIFYNFSPKKVSNTRGSIYKLIRTLEDEMYIYNTPHLGLKQNKWKNERIKRDLGDLAKDKGSYSPKCKVRFQKSHI